MRIGWIGLGAMGLGMARCSARAGHAVVGHTRGNPAHAGLIADGGRLERDLAATVTGCDLVCLNLFDTAQVEDVLFGQALLAGLAPGTSLVLHTTSAPHLATGIASAAPTGVTVIDAAFSGSPQQAAEGALTMMAGGREADFARVAPVLATYAVNLHHVGPLGSGMRLKLLNNLLFGAHLSLAREAFRLAAETGISAPALAEVISGSSGASAALAMLGRHQPPGEISEGMQRYLAKDIVSATAAAMAEGLDLGLLETVASAIIGKKTEA
ncbi:MAG: NAD(P)-dependent oxidoreductase [Novosphingobium sp.]|nr:NAD(P)-dependent oxidoreductase [Novosphingobium sp.]